MPLELLQVDAFTDRPFAGNPAGVCLLPTGGWPDDGWLRAVAAEVNVAETAFLLAAGPARWDLRWFTPTVEVDLCGHATVASAHALRTRWGVEAATLTFATRSGDLPVTVAADGRLVLELAADPPVPAPARPDLLAALGLDAGRVEVLASSAFDVVVLDGAEAVAAVEPDQLALARACPHAVIVTAAGGGGDVDVVSRVFAPAVGIPEDPATGSAHCILAPLWTDRLGRARVDFFQAFPTRGGAITTEMRGDRVILTGQAVTTVESRLRV